MSTEDILKIRAGDLIPNPHNPRQTYDEELIQELADSMVGVGQLSPVLVRPFNGKFEIVAGHRRWLAKKKIGGDDELVDCISRDLSDEDSLQAAIVENAAREGVHPMEEAVAFDKLLRMGLSSAQVTVKTGKRMSYINSRLRLLGLGKKSRELFLANRMSLDAAYILARVEESSQDACLRHANVTGEDTISDWDVQRGLRSVLHRLSEAPWDLEANYAKKTPCSSCPYRTQAQSELFDDGLSSEDDSCTRPKCWDAKMKHYYKEQEKKFKDHPVDGNLMILGDTYVNEGGVSHPIFNMRSLSYYAPFVDLALHCNMRAALCIKPHESQVDEGGNFINFPQDQALRWSDAYQLVFGEKPQAGDKDVWLAKDGEGFPRFLLGRDTSKKILRAFKKNPTQVNYQTGRTNEQEDQLKEERKKNRLLQKAGEKIAPSVIELGSRRYDPRVVLIALKNTYPFSRASEEKLSDMIRRLKDPDLDDVNAEINEVILKTLFSEKDWMNNHATLTAARMLGFDIDTAIEEALAPKKKSKDKKPKLESANPEVPDEDG